MNEEEKKTIKKLKQFIKSYGDMSIISAKEMKTILILIKKQERVIKTRSKEIESLYKMMLVKDDEIEKLKDEYKREVFEHQEFVEDTKVAVQDYIKKDEIKEKMRGEINKRWRNTEQRKCQLYAYDILKELLGE